MCNPCTMYLMLPYYIVNKTWWGWTDKGLHIHLPKAPYWHYPKCSNIKIPKLQFFVMWDFLYCEDFCTVNICFGTFLVALYALPPWYKGWVFVVVVTKFLLFGAKATKTAVGETRAIVELATITVVSPVSTFHWTRLPSWLRKYFPWSSLDKGESLACQITTPFNKRIDCFVLILFAKTTQLIVELGSYLASQWLPFI